MRKGSLGFAVILLAASQIVADEPQLSNPPSIPTSDAVNSAQDWPSSICPDGQNGRQYPFWFQADYLLWWTRDNHVPPLLTTGSPTDARPGALGQPSTSVLFGGSVNNQPYSGARFSAGLWFNPQNTLGIEGSYFFLSQRSVRFTAASTGPQVLGRPLVDVTPGDSFEFAEILDPLAFPHILAGSASVILSTRLQGYETNLASEFLARESYRAKLLGGFRFLGLDDALSFSESTISLASLTSISVSSSNFDTQNRFYGGQFGAEVTAARGPFSLNLRGMLGLGVGHQGVKINGTTTATEPFGMPFGITNTVANGPFALPSNIGVYSRDVFSVVPEIRVNGAFQMTDHVRLNVGYSFLAWTNVARPGDQIDRVTNTSQLSPPVGLGNLIGPARPQFSFRDSTFWAQGINCGIELRY